MEQTQAIIEDPESHTEDEAETKTNKQVAKLYIFPRDKFSGRTIDLKIGANTIGRAIENAICLPFSDVSGKHAILTVDSDLTGWLEDLGSMNKTKIGEKFLLPRRNFEVSDGKEITFGATKAQYMIVVDEKEKGKENKEKLEKERLEKEQLEKERIEKERLENERLEKERIEREKLEQERLERERLERERLEKERLERERLERERIERERLEKERLERERLEKERLEKERLEKERLERERSEKERLEKERIERERLEQERLEKERIERERLEKERLEKERLEKEKLENERIQREKLEENGDGDDTDCTTEDSPKKVRNIEEEATQAIYGIENEDLTQPIGVEVERKGKQLFFDDGKSTMPYPTDGATLPIGAFHDNDDDETEDEADKQNEEGMTQAMDINEIETKYREKVKSRHQFPSEENTIPFSSSAKDDATQSMNVDSDDEKTADEMDVEEVKSITTPVVHHSNDDATQPIDLDADDEKTDNEKTDNEKTDNEKTDEFSGFSPTQPIVDEFSPFKPKNNQSPLEKSPAFISKKVNPSTTVPEPVVIIKTLDFDSATEDEGLVPLKIDPKKKTVIPDDSETEHVDSEVELKKKSDSKREEEEMERKKKEMEEIKKKEEQKLEEERRIREQEEEEKKQKMIEEERKKKEIELQQKAKEDEARRLKELEAKRKEEEEEEERRRKEEKEREEENERIREEERKKKEKEKEMEEERKREEERRKEEEDRRKEEERVKEEERIKEEEKRKKEEEKEKELEAQKRKEEEEKLEKERREFEEELKKDEEDSKKNEDEKVEDEPKRGRGARGKTRLSQDNSQESEETPAKKRKRETGEVTRKKSKIKAGEEDQPSDDSQSSTKSKFSPPPLRQSKSFGQHPKVAFTGIIDEKRSKIIQTYGGEIVDTIYDCTHVATDKIRRTIKFLCAISLGKIIVDLSWIDACANMRCLVDEKQHLLKDPPVEKQYQFSLGESIRRASEKKLFENYKIYLTPNVQPDHKAMKEMIECSGGEIVTKIDSPSEDLIVISCEKDKTDCQKLIGKGFDVHSNEIVLTGLLVQHLDLTKFQLDKQGKPIEETHQRRKKK